MSRLLAVVIMSALPIALFACGDNNDSTPRATSETLFPPTATGTQGSFTPLASATGGPTDTFGPNEGGEAPIFWRTADDFSSVVAGQPYTVLFRITNGYNAQGLIVGAVCKSCAGQRITSFEGLNSPPFPAGSDLPGSYYPMNMVFPLAGRWEISIIAISDHATIPIDVKPAT